MCQNLQSLRSSEENLFHICIFKKLLLWLLNTLHRNLWTHLWYSCGLNHHTRHNWRPSSWYKAGLTHGLAKNDEVFLGIFPSLSPCSPCFLLVSGPVLLLQCEWCLTPLAGFALSPCLFQKSECYHRHTHRSLSGGGKLMEAGLFGPMAPGCP